jgi:uncharacterized protein with FMN-binding domain
MKKYILPFLVVVAFGIYVLLSSQKSIQVPTNPTTSANPGTTGTDFGSAPSSGQTSGTATGSPVPTSVSTATPMPVSAPTPTGMYKDGSYTGSVADAYFGNLQVQAVIQGGKLVDCLPLQYPSDSGHSRQVSNTSLPILKQEAIKAQSANVDIVSGATQTSQAFQQSLGAALALAKN